MWVRHVKKNWYLRERRISIEEQSDSLKRELFWLDLKLTMFKIRENISRIAQHLIINHEKKTQETWPWLHKIHQPGHHYIQLLWCYSESETKSCIRGWPQLQPAHQIHKYIFKSQYKNLNKNKNECTFNTKEHN